jgi:hypothetical protein
MHSLHTIPALLAMAAIVTSGHAHAQEAENESGTKEDIGFRLETFGNRGTSLPDLANAEGSNGEQNTGNLSIVPVPILNPTLKAGLGAAAIYSFGNSTGRSTLFAGGGKTGNGSWLAGAGGSLHVDDDRFRIQFAAGGGELQLKYYGVGPDSFLADNPIDFSGTGWAAQIKPEIRIADSLYVGVLARYMDAKIAVEIPIEVLPDISVPFKITFAGPVASFDTRDQPNWPTSGVFIDTEYLFAKETAKIFNFGINTKFHTFNLSGSTYFGFDDDLVLAVNARAASAGDDTPFFLKPSVSIRGFSSGEALNTSVVEAQAELRWMMSQKLGLVAFAGLGATGKSFSSVGNTSGAYGAGVRYRFSQIDKSNLGFDVARKKNGWAAYFTVGEAF